MADSIGLATPNKPPTPKPRSKIDVAAGGSTVGKIGFALEAFGSGVRGKSPAFERALEAKREEKTNKLKEFQAGLTAAKDGISLMKGLRGDEKTKAIDNLVSNFDDPDMQSLVRSSAENPAEAFALEGTLNTPEIQQMLKIDPTGKLLVQTLGTEAGRKFLIQDPADKKFLLPSLGKIDPLIKWYQTNNPEVIAKAQEDGFVDIPELQSLNDQAPEGIRLSEEEFGVVSAERNRKALSQQGIDVPEAFTERQKGDAKTNIGKLQAERNALEDKLAIASPEERAKLQRDLNTQNAAILKATTIVGRTPEDIETTGAKTSKQRKIANNNLLINSINNSIRFFENPAGAASELKSLGRGLIAQMGEFINDDVSGAINKVLIDPEKASREDLSRFLLTQVVFDLAKTLGGRDATITKQRVKLAEKALGIGLLSDPGAIFDKMVALKTVKQQENILLGDVQKTKRFKTKDGRIFEQVGDKIREVKSGR